MRRCMCSARRRAPRWPLARPPALAGRARSLVRWRGATFFARQLPVEDEAAHRGPTHAQGVLGRQRRLGRLMDQPAHRREGSRVTESPPATRAGRGLMSPVARRRRRSFSIKD
jgi:hypothetical protein